MKRPRHLRKEGQEKEHCQQISVNPAQAASIQQNMTNWSCSCCMFSCFNRQRWCYEHHRASTVHLKGECMKVLPSQSTVAVVTLNQRHVGFKWIPAVICVLGRKKYQYIHQNVLIHSGRIILFFKAHSSSQYVKMITFHQNMGKYKAFICSCQPAKCQQRLALVSVQSISVTLSSWT